jgi:4-amino-4-deoxy-L-arabinose transferase-like glycosyltransferase
MTTQLRETSPAEPTKPPRGRLARLVLGRPTDPVWARPALWAVLILAGFLYSWDLSRNGDANTFYAAAVLSGTESWKAFFYGSLDSASFITVDKPPFAFWVMGISARIFGFNSWSLLLPQAAEGVAAVAVVYAAVRRSVAGLTGERGAHAAGLIAALALTLTPVVVAIDRDDNPDTMLTLLLTLGAWGLLESLRASRPDRDPEREGKGHPLAWLMLSAVAFGLAFNTKMLEGFIPLPAIAVVYLAAANGRLRTRIGRLLAAGGVLAVITLSWMTIVDLIPKSSRPYVSGSTNDTVWNLAVDYNGFGRLTGGGFGRAFTGPAAGTGPTAGAAPRAGTGAGGGFGGDFGGSRGGGGIDPGELAHRTAGFGGFGGQAGIGRIFGATLGGQISWLIPFAIIALIGTLILLGRRPRADLARASVLLWGGWLLLEFLVLSFQQGIQHSYYTSAMAPPIAALTGIGAVAFYQAYRRRSVPPGARASGEPPRGRSVPTGARASGEPPRGRSVPTGARASGEPPRGRSGWGLLLPLAIAVTGGWSFVLLRRTPSWNPWLSWAVLGATVVAVLALASGWLRGRAVPAGRSRLLVAAGVTGLIAVLAGPAAYAVTPLSRPIQGTNPVAGPSAGGAFGGLGIPAGVLRDFADFGARGGFGTGEFGGGGFGTGEFGTGESGRGELGTGGLGVAGLGEGAGRAGALGGVASTKLIAYLEAHRDGATWLIAVRGSDAAAAIILQTGGIPVMAMGGFSGTDPAPTVAQLQQYVAEGKLHYVLLGGAGGFGGFGGGAAGTASSVTSWVEQNCTAVPASAYGGSAASSAAGGGSGGLYRCG